jgi:hypothetical protein
MVPPAPHARPEAGGGGALVPGIRIHSPEKKSDYSVSLVIQRAVQYG